jgi:sugar lactone lactonase YvrE
MHSIIRSLIFVCLTAITGWCQPYIISTIAGTERLLDGNPAINVPLRDPRSIKFDVAGNFYIADTGDHRIRKVNQSGVISTIAGNGLPGFSGDRGKATAAQLSSPTSLAFDGNGNLYIADRDNFRVRRISSDGIINTVAGIGTPGLSGDNGPAVSAQVYPFAVATDSKGNLYIADLTFRIRKVDATTGIITTIAGTGMQGYSGDNGPAAMAAIDVVFDLAVGPDGSVYLADFGNLRVRKIDPSGMMKLVAGNGEFGFVAEGVPATLALMAPQGVAVDTFGNVYISDFNRDQVRKVDVGTGLINTVAGDGTTGFGGDNGMATKAQLNSPFGLALDSSGLYFADQGNQRIRRINAGIISTVAGTSIRDGGPATSAFLNLPIGIAVDGANNINTFGQLQAPPIAVATDQAGNFYVTDEEPRILKITPAGVTSIVAGNGQPGYSGDGGPAINAMISEPTGVAVDISGNVYFTDYLHNRIRRVAASTGTVSTIAGNGTLIFGGDNGPALSAGMDPYDIAVDSRSNIYVADRFNFRIRKIAPDGTITTVAGTGFPGYSGDGGPATAAMLTNPTGVAVDNGGNLYITDRVNNVIRRVTASGLITTIAGTGVSRPATGDGGPALAAQLNPARVAVDVAGNVYVTDAVNDRVRKLTPQAVTP